VLFPLIGGAGVLAAAAWEAETGPDWLGLALGAVAGAGAFLAYTVKLAREGRLFLRGKREIEQSRERIDRVSVPLGWALGAALVLVGLLAGGTAYVVLLGVLGGTGLGIFPGVFANFLRLRREEWSRE
jgi:hypothetical protein